jgi:hypothetical protein
MAGCKNAKGIGNDGRPNDEIGAGGKLVELGFRASLVFAATICGR